MRIAAQIVLKADERDELTALIRPKRTRARLALHARIILLASERMQGKDIAAELAVERRQVSRRRQRYATPWLSGIERDRPRAAAQSRCGAIARTDHREQARGSAALKCANDGSATRRECGNGLLSLAGAKLEVASRTRLLDFTSSGIY